jgi:hypothetical protein
MSSITAPRSSAYPIPEVEYYSDNESSDDEEEVASSSIKLETSEIYWDIPEGLVDPPIHHYEAVDKADIAQAS